MLWRLLWLRCTAAAVFDDCFASTTWSIDALDLGEDPHVMRITAQNFRHVIDQGAPVLLNLYSPTCPHCRALAPHVDAVAERLRAARSSVRVARVDCKEQTTVCQAWLGVRGIPELWYFPGDGRRPHIGYYHQERHADAITAWALQNEQLYAWAARARERAPEGVAYGSPFRISTNAIPEGAAAVTVRFASLLEHGVVDLYWRWHDDDGAVGDQLEARLLPGAEHHVRTTPGAVFVAKPHNRSAPTLREWRVAPGILRYVLIRRNIATAEGGRAVDEQPGDFAWTWEEREAAAAAAALTTTSRDAEEAPAAAARAGGSADAHRDL